MNRRQAIFALGTALLAAPLPSFAQAQRKVWRIGTLMYGRNMVGTRALVAFRAGLRDLGYVEGRNLEIIERWSDTNYEESDRLAVELVALKPDLILAGSAAIFSAVRARATMPVVFGFSGDPVVGKLVASLAHPGGNLTGMTFLSLELVGKRMELLKEMLPNLKRVAAIANPQHPGKQAELRLVTSSGCRWTSSLGFSRLRWRGGSIWLSRCSSPVYRCCPLF